jgi:hypothetical protein
VTSISGSLPVVVTGTTTPNITVQASSTSQSGVVQLNDTTTSNSTSQALTAAQGKNLQDQINALSVTTNLTFAGTINASTGNMVSVTTAGAAVGFSVGNPLPAAAAGNAEYFVIVTIPGTMTPPGGTAQLCHQGDWWLSELNVWQFLDIGYNAPYASTTTPGIVQLATDAEVLVGTNTTNAVVPSSLQNKLSNSVSTVSATTIASSTAAKTAYDAGIQGQTDAAAAQTDATQALADAAAAQTDATQALADAAAAQATADAAIPDATFTALGELLVGTGNATYVPLDVGSGGQVLSVNATCPTGLEWITPSGGSSPATPTVAGTVLGLTNNTNANVALGCCSFIVLGAGLNNTAIGFCSQIGLTTGSSNTSLGAYALKANQVANNNTAVGTSALCTSTSGQGNTAIGTSAMLSLGSGNCNVAVGNNALRAMNGSGCNTAIGANALCQTTSGGCNFAGGQNALTANTSGAENTATGYTSLGANAGGSGNTGVGARSLAILASGGDNTAIGRCAANTQTAGSSNVAIGSGIQLPLTTGSCQLVIGFGTTCWLTGCSTGAIRPGFGILDCTGSGGTVGQVLASDGGNAVCWQSVGTVTCIDTSSAFTGGPFTTTGTLGLATTTVTAGAYVYPASITVDACGRITAATAGANAAPVTRLNFAAKGDILAGSGSNAFSALTLGTDGQILYACAACPQGICWGSSTSSNASPTVGGIVFGCTTSVGTNVSLGYDSLTAIGAGLGNTVVGYGSLCSNIIGNNNTVVGCGSARAMTGSGLVAVGQNALPVTTSQNIAIGNCAGLAVTTATGNILIGDCAMCRSNTGNNIAIGNLTLCGLQTCNGGNVAIGNLAGCALAAGQANVFIGNRAGLAQLNGFSNVAIGGDSSYLGNGGTRNVVIGHTSGIRMAGLENVVIGAVSASNYSTSCYSILIGTFAANSLSANANSNVIIGHSAYCAATGASALNVVIGHQAGLFQSLGSQNVLIGPVTSLPVANGSCQLAIGFGNNNWLTGCSTKAIKPGAGIVDCANSCGTAGQVLMSNGANAVCWGGGVSGTFTFGTCTVTICNGLITSVA